MISSNKFDHPRTLFLVGSYTIGKEEVYLAAARASGIKVHVSAAKRRILECLELSTGDKEMITTDSSEARIHVVPMGCINFKHLALCLKMGAGRYKTVVGIRPTGWSFASAPASSSAAASTGVEKALGVTRHTRGSLVLYGVPYSEHSSFSELRQMVQQIGAKRIVPTVNGGSAEKRAEMLWLLTNPRPQGA
eukprot:CAMPEP_0184299542 /NCGR_PEP_ID=MMETSP1049-20130417/10134_1 /TAXON_ID=77928 /ORGANISM="Proteomonas sulcata, Strain CCMP704" /LENGTH=191 /DNA_ID=CAMNT_0026610009 /DNA_START=1 /DNA_END=576 /DNA_ORIENTATION=+